MQLVFERMGGVEAVAECEPRNPNRFYTLYAPLATNEVPYPVATGVVSHCQRRSAGNRNAERTRQSWLHP